MKNKPITQKEIAQAFRIAMESKSGTFMAEEVLNEAMAKLKSTGRPFNLEKTFRAGCKMIEPNYFGAKK